MRTPEATKPFMIFKLSIFTMSSFVCVVCVYVRACMQLHVYTCWWRPEVNVMPLPLSLFICYFSVVMKCHGLQNLDSIKLG